MWWGVVLGGFGSYHGRKMPFITPLQIEPVGRRLFKHVAPLIYVTVNGVRYEIPFGRVTDLGSTWSIPLIATKYDGLFPMACSIHDMLYDGEYEGEVISRKEADAVFYEAMGAENEWYVAHGGKPCGSEAERYSMWLGVALGGGFFFRGKVDGYEHNEPVIST